MVDEKRKCEKCGQEMFQSGPYLHSKDEGQPVYKGLEEIYYSCNNENCENFGEYILEFVKM